MEDDQCKYEVRGSPLLTRDTLAERSNQHLGKVPRRVLIVGEKQNRVDQFKLYQDKLLAGVDTIDAGMQQRFVNQINNRLGLLSTSSGGITASWVPPKSI